jgi:hypothetical protein
MRACLRSCVHVVQVTAMATGSGLWWPSARSSSSMLLLWRHHGGGVRGMSGACCRTVVVLQVAPAPPGVSFAEEAGSWLLS